MLRALSGDVPMQRETKVEVIPAQRRRRLVAPRVKRSDERLDGISVNVPATPKDDVVRFTRWVIATAVAVACLASVTTAQTKECAATVFVLQDLEKGVSVTSPDNRYRVTLSVRSEDDDFGQLRVYAGDDMRGSYELHDLSGGIFIKWSPDSRAFYLMWSNGGAIGGYEVRAFRITGGQVTETVITKKAEDEFERKHPCPDRGHNVYAVRWLNGSEELLLAMQVYPTSDCGKELGLYGGYLVGATDGTILRRYSERQLKSIWPVGCPSDIYPTGLWGSDDLKKAQESLKALQAKKVPKR
jgi:hypothetical protein